ncbi:MAG: hypothetical protein K0R41_3116 [Geminicoccaceae bacterium]|jgi:uncharacterized Zn-finger protein|nr:hypothetical protein [Geminicoccaceae bacterium]
MGVVGGDEGPVVQDEVEVDTPSVACDGGCGPLGHPRVYLAIEPSSGEVECPYCSRRFIYRPGGATAPGPGPGAPDPV